VPNYLDPDRPSPFVLWRSLTILVAIDIPLALGVALYASIARDWPAYEAAAAGVCVSWILPLLWAGWLALRRVKAE
jgi:hypothetical protein